MGTDRSAKLKRTLVILVVLALSGIALYALAGFLLAPRLIERKLEAMVGQGTGLTLAIEAVAVNPFTLTLSLDNVTLLRAENTSVMAVDRVDARVRAASFLERGWRLHDVVVVRPRVSLELADRSAAGASSRTRPPATAGGSGMILALEDVLLVQPRAGGFGFDWSAERLAGTAATITQGHGLGIEADVVIEALDVSDAQGRAILAVPSVVGRRVVLRTSPAAVSIGAAELDNPRLTLQRDSSGEFHLPPGLASLLSPAAAGSGTRFAISAGRLDFTDRSLPSPVQLIAEGVEGTLTGRFTGGEAVAAVSLRGRIPETGAGTVTAEWLLSRPRAGTRLELDVQGIELSAIAPYVEGMIGRPPTAGRMDLAARLHIDEAALDLDNRLVIEGLQLGERAGNSIGDLPLDTAVALLEDERGQIAISVPVSPARHDVGLAVTGDFSLALADYVQDLTAAPFEYLAGLAGSPGLELGILRFRPGSAEVRGEARAKLRALKQVLGMRPRLGLTVYPGLGPAADREALATQQIRLHVNLAASAAMPGEAAEKPIDFDDPKVHTVLDEFAENRLPSSQQAALANRFPERDATHYRAVFEALVDNETVARSALVRLARYRAQSVVEELLGSDDDRSRVQQARVLAAAEPGDDGAGVVRIEVRHHDRTEAAATARRANAPEAPGR